MTFVTIPASCSFLDEIAQRWIKEIGLVGVGEERENAGTGIILVPGRRAGRHLMEAFLRVLDGKAALLPAIMILGESDEETLFPLGVEENLYPAIDSTRRIAILARLILSTPIFAPIFGSGEVSIDRAWPLACSLVQLMDEAERHEVSLKEMLPEAVKEEEFSEHWQKILKFLSIITEIWPNFLEENKLSNPQKRLVTLLNAQAKSWREHPIHIPIWAIGFVDGTSGIATALGAIASLPQGKVILQGVDCDLEEILWDILPEGHPQSLFRDLLRDLDNARSEVIRWGEAENLGREALLRDVFLLVQGLEKWGIKRGRCEEEARCQGLFMLPAEDIQQEAQSIALLLRDIAEEKGKNAALITPDRDLAQRVRAELLRFGVYADDSAGEPLQQTPSAVFLRLIIEAVEKKFSPVALLSVLKHPLTSLGFPISKARHIARLLEIELLRGAAPLPGVEGLRAALYDITNPQKRTELEERFFPFLERLEKAFSPLSTLAEKSSLSKMIEALIEVAEFLAATEEEYEAQNNLSLNGSREEEEKRLGERLWAGEDGDALSRHLLDLLIYLEDIPEQDIRVFGDFLAISMAGKSITGLRGHQDGIELAHPRISILGILEARLLSFDRVILGGLNEGIWPAFSDPGPWLSRPMRSAIGLLSPERQIGASAHDFISAALSSKEVIFSYAKRRDGKQTAQARWLLRLEAYLKGAENYSLPIHPAYYWQKKMDLPLKGKVRMIEPPEPCPPISLRPRRLSITEIDQLKHDPYTIYAKHILGIYPLQPLEQGIEYADYGMIVHAALEEFYRLYPHKWSKNAQSLLENIFEKILEKKKSLRPSLCAWWRPRLKAIAQWVIEQEKERITERACWTSYTEQTARYFYHDLPGGVFELVGRADRIDLAEADEGGNLKKARIIDYKTGQPPTKNDVEQGWNSQMTLEAEMLEKAAFKNLPAAKIEGLIYWKVSGGGLEGGKVFEMDLEKIETDTLACLRSLLEKYDDDTQPYRSQPLSDKDEIYKRRYSEYAQLARVEEWRNHKENDEEGASS